MADPTEDYPTEIEENLNEFDSSVTSVQNMVQSLISVSRNNHLVKVSSTEHTNQCYEPSHTNGFLCHAFICLSLIQVGSS